MADFLYGVQYYRPPGPPQSDWTTDLRNIKKQGFNAVKIWLVWRWINPKPEGYDFGELDELMDEIERNDLRAICNLILENVPAWVPKVHPETMGIDVNGKPIRPQAKAAWIIGGYPGICFDNPLSRQLGSKFLHQVVSRYKDREALYAWDAWNEFHGVRSCYCQHTQRQFVNWLREKYCRIENVNRVWCRNYADWEEVEVIDPSVQNTFSDRMDWMRFERERVLAELRWRISEIQKSDAVHPTGCHTGMPTTLLFNINDWEAARNSAFYGSSLYYDMPSWGIREYREMGLALDTLRSASRKFWVSELQCGSIYPLDSSIGRPAPIREKIINSGLRCISHGAKGILYWQWRPEITGMEAYGFSLTTSDGSLTERCEAAREIAGFIEENRVLLEKAEVPASDVVILVDSNVFFLDSAIEQTKSWTTADRYIRSIKGFYHLFNDLRLQADIVTPEKLRNGFRGVIIVPFPLLFKIETTRRLEKIVDNGATLIIEAMAGLFDENGVGSKELPGQQLKFLLGCESEGFKPGNPLMNIWEREIRGYMYKEWYRPLTAETIGSFEDHTAAVMKNTFGEGEAIAVGTFIGMSYYESRDPGIRQTMERFIASKVEKYIDVDFPLEIRKLECGQESLYFIFNSTAEAITSPIVFKKPVRLEDLVTGEVTESGDCITLSPWNVGVLKSS